MLLHLLKAKLHKATVTDASVDYEGSLTIASDLAKLVGFLPYERILVGNMGNGQRFETYVIYGPEGSGAIELNGATAHLGKIGDRLTIMTFCALTEAEAATHHPCVALLDEKNQVLRTEGLHS
jgi:aspartate 1-decarboxylase